MMPKSVFYTKPLVISIIHIKLVMSTLLETTNKTTTIKLRVTTRQRLAKHGAKDQTYDDLINDLLDKINFGDNQ